MAKAILKSSPTKVRDGNFSTVLKVEPAALRGSGRLRNVPSPVFPEILPPPKADTIPKITGTKEWAVKNVNILYGCSHGCRYCYAKAIARRFKRIKTAEEWKTPKLRIEEVAQRRRKYKGRVMFPSTHDITPEFLEPSLIVLDKLLAAGNQVLIVSKPHFECIERICKEFEKYKAQILFRFSIGAGDDAILAFWEPGAPRFDERFKCLKYAHSRGFATSVSMEPMLDAPNALELFHRFKEHVTDSIWLGKMNRPRAVGKDRPADVEKKICELEANQTDGKVRAIYESLKDEPLVRWKESIKDVMGLPLALEAGTDQ